MQTNSVIEHVIANLSNEEIDFVSGGGAKDWIAAGIAIGEEAYEFAKGFWAGFTGN